MKSKPDKQVNEVSTGSSSVQNFLRLPKVCEVTGLKTSTLYEMMKNGRFPRPIAITKRLVVWPEEEVAKWQAAKLATVKGGR